MKKLIIVLFLILPIFMFGQVDDIDLAHQRFLIEQTIQEQVNMMQIQLQLQIDEIHNRIFIDRLMYDVCGPGKGVDFYINEALPLPGPFPCNLREPVERLYNIYLLPNPPADGFPYVMLNNLDIYTWRLR
jgi:hypothetical protein